MNFSSLYKIHSSKSRYIQSKNLQYCSSKEEDLDNKDLSTEDSFDDNSDEEHETENESAMNHEYSMEVFLNGTENCQDDKNEISEDDHCEEDHETAKISYCFNEDATVEYFKSMFVNEVHNNVDEALFCERSKPHYTEGHFVQRLCNIGSQYNIPRTALVDFQLLLDECSDSHLNVGLHECPGRKRKLVSNIDNYLREDIREHKVNVCVKGCTVYSKDYKRDIKCLHCDSFRFFPCTKPNCRNPITCNPFNGPHNVKYRTSRESYYYRPVIPLLMKLVKEDINKELHMFSFIEEVGDANKLHHMWDILNGDQAKSALEEMHDNFKRLEDNTIIERSILLSEAYDGGSLFDRSNLSVWPLTISILNFNPSTRIKIGVGLFVIALHCLKIGTVAEDSIFSELFIPELKALEKGMLYNFESKGTSVRVFLQARLIVHSQDTRAIEKTMLLQCKSYIVKR